MSIQHVGDVGNEEAVRLPEGHVAELFWVERIEVDVHVDRPRRGDVGNGDRSKTGCGDVVTFSIVKGADSDELDEGGIDRREYARRQGGSAFAKVSWAHAVERCAG